LKLFVVAKATEETFESYGGVAEKCGKRSHGGV
jgi:hypothetical protein